MLNPLATVYDALRMLWFVSGAIGLVELLRFLQQRVPALRHAWPQGLLFGVTAAVVFGVLFGALHVVDIKEIALIVPFLGMLAGPEGVIVGGAVLALAVPQFAVGALATAALAWLLLRVHRSPLFALAAAWLWIGLQGPLYSVLHGLVLHPAIDTGVSALGAIALYAYVHEVDRRHRDLLAAEQRSATDPLTGLLSRGGLADWFKSHPNQDGAVVMIDLDDFKPINELYGHASGDLVLQQATKRLLACVRPTDALARLGGDEFLAVLPGADVHASVAAAQRMLDQLDHEDLELGGGLLRLRASFGIAVGQCAQCQPLADAALLRAKADGKGRIVVHGETSPRDDEDGQLLRVTSFARDLLFQLPLGVVVTSRSRRIVAASPAYERLSGVKERAMRGRKPRRVIGTTITDRAIYPEVARSLDGGGKWEGEFVDRRPNGETWWADWAMAPVDVRGRRLGYLGVVRDATERHREQAEMLAEVIGILSERDDPSIRDHLRRVRRYMELLATSWQEAFGRDTLPLDPEEYGIAAMLHDVGKLSIPGSILKKPGPLTPEERAIVNQHPTLGVRHLQTLCTSWCRGPRSEYMRLLLDLATTLSLYHHERFDGSGYPSGVKGEDIPLAARLFAAVDVYDALQAHRPYKLPWGEAAAFDYLKQRSEKDFDAQVILRIAALRGRKEWREVSASASVGAMQ